MVIPYISRDDVSAALSSLIHTTSKLEATGLEHLLLVDLRVTAPDMPAGDDVRRFALRELLVTEIAAALAEGRRLFGLDTPDMRAPLRQALTTLAEDAAAGAHDLLAWSILYYRFVRADLSLSVEGLADVIGVHTRTISRYIDDGSEMLTERLIRAEQEARLRHRQRQLYTLLPNSVPIRAVGRDDLLRATEESLAALSPRHILITGTTGIGKTTFVQELMRRQIDAGNLDHLVWLYQPGSVQFIRQQVGEALLRDDGQVTLRDYLLLYRVAVVLDQIEMAASDQRAFADLLRDLGAALVCLISRNPVVAEGIEASLTLTEIDRSAAEIVVVDALRLRPALSAEDRHEIALALYDHIGGNPLALKLAAGLWEHSDGWQALDTVVQENLLGRLFAILSADERRAWGALALFPSPVQIDELTVLRGVQVDSVAALVRLALVDQSPAGTYTLVGGARDHLRQQYAVSADVRALFDDLLTQLEVDAAAQEVVEQVLSSGFPEFDRSRRAEWISACYPEGLRRGRWARWRAILETYLHEADPEDAELRIAYGVCLRHLADWEGARQVFYSVAAQSGRDGRFAEQAQALTEWSILSRNRGDYEQALDLIGQARRYAQRVRDDDLLALLARQEAQILVQAGRAGEAYAQLVALPETVQSLTLQSEALLALGDRDGCRSLAVRALRLVSRDPATEASLYTIVGRSYERDGDHDRAHGYLTDAVTLLERSDDPFVLARAQTNLAAVLIPMRRYHDAGTLLTRAEAVQSRLGDKVGLGTTRHNRTILGGYIAG